MEEDAEGLENFRDLCEMAASGEHDPAEFVGDLCDAAAARERWRWAKSCWSAFAKLSKTLTAECAKQAKAVCRTDLDLALALRDVERCQQYFYDECEIAAEALDSWRQWLFSGHLIRAALGFRRPGGESDEQL